MGRKKKTASNEYAALDSVLRLGKTIALISKRTGLSISDIVTKAGGYADYLANKKGRGR